MLVGKSDVSNTKYWGIQKLLQSLTAPDAVAFFSLRKLSVIVDLTPERQPSEFEALRAQFESTAGNSSLFSTPAAEHEIQPSLSA